MNYYELVSGAVSVTNSRYNLPSSLSGTTDYGESVKGHMADA